MKKATKIGDIGKPAPQMVTLEIKDLIKLPPPLNQPLNEQQPLKLLTDEQSRRIDASLDGISAIGILKPGSQQEEEEIVRKFLGGIEKLLSEENNWTFLKPLTLSLKYCASCQTCSDACPVYTASGKQEIYRPTYRSEILRAIIQGYLKKKGLFNFGFTAKKVDLNWSTLARLAELSYRCTLCRRCAQACPLGIDNGLIAHEFRKVFSQELGIAPKELHQMGTVRQLDTGSSTGMRPKAFEDIRRFMEEEIEEKTGKKIAIPVDVKGADILLVHNAGEFVSWPENPEAFAILFDALGISWTLSSELAGYDAVNYGAWYDDFQLARIAMRHVSIAKDLKVNKIVVGECGHAHKATIVLADRLLPPDLAIPRISCLPVLEDIVLSGKLKLDPQRNNFPVTLHDPCNIVRMMGISQPQRRILRSICPQFVEMEPHGVDNYCCGGGGGFAVMNSLNFPDWRMAVAGRMKIKQIVETFRDTGNPETKKYVCAPCSNCKAQLRDLLEYYKVEEKINVAYIGLAELIVNAMPDLKEPFLP